jgi:hypothetical protein
MTQIIKSNANKTEKPIYKEQGKRMNRLYGMIAKHELSYSNYLLEVQNVLDSLWWLCKGSRENSSILH